MKQGCKVEQQENGNNEEICFFRHSYHLFLPFNPYAGLLESSKKLTYPLAFC